MQEKNVIILIFVICFVLISIMIGFITLILFYHQKKQNAYDKNLEEIRGNAQKEVLRSQLEMQEQTFQYISQEIHDNIGQLISLAKLQLNTLDIGGNQPLGEKIKYSASLLTTALDDLRDLSRSLSTELIRHLGLADAVKLQVDQLRKSSGYEIDFSIEGNYLYQDEQKEIIIFRILQEAINNIVRHSMANRVSIVLSCLPDQMILKIQDNGKGFDMATVLDSGTTHITSGFGNMRRRTSLLKADLQINSAPGKGTTINIIIPDNSLV